MAKYDPNYEGIGLDECNLDVTNYLSEKNINNQQQIYELASNLINYNNQPKSDNRCLT